MVVGFDKRFDSEHFAAAVAEVLAANGLKVWLTDGPTPTPVIAYAVLDRKAKGAINITASHNPPTDNGFKVRDPHGGAIDPQGLTQIEALIPGSEGVRRMPYAAAQAKGLIQVFDAAPAYIENLKLLVDLAGIRAAGLKVLVDPMWGNGGGWFPRLLAGGRTTVQEIHNQRNPLFPEMRRPEPIPPNVDVGLRTTVEQHADVLLITDGDADRMGIGDEQGRFLNQLQVMALLALYLLEVRGQRGPIVKTLSTTSMLNRLGELYGVPVYETGVGFKYVAPKMMETDAILGGEESGAMPSRATFPSAMASWATCCSSTSWSRPARSRRNCSRCCSPKSGRIITTASIRSSPLSSAIPSASAWPRLSPAWCWAGSRWPASKPPTASSSTLKAAAGC